MKIGLDFDGVITNCGKLKSIGVKKLFDIDIPPERCSRDYIIENNILTSSQYEMLKYNIYEKYEFKQYLEPVDGAIYNIQKLINLGHKLRIVTSRAVNASYIAMIWLMERDLKIPLCSAAYGGDKDQACTGLDVFIDDDIDKLEKIVSVPNKFLFTWGYNEHIRIVNDSITRVDSWDKLYNSLMKITT